MLLNNYQSKTDLLIDWIIEATPAHARVLDVGANDGSFCPQVERVAGHVALLAGVDPDTAKLNKNPHIQERYAGRLEDAPIPDARFDCLYAIYVLEHVLDEWAFMQSAARVLKPGGSLFFITPNAYHYFATIARLLDQVALQGKVLKLLRPETLVAQYHYPAKYRLNSPRGIWNVAKACGFTDVEYRYSEKLDELTCYFPGPLKAFPRWWEKMVSMTGKEQLLANLMGRIIR